MLVLFLIFLLLYALPKILIDRKQLTFIRQKLDASAVILNHEDYHKAGLYAIEKLRFSIFSTLFECALFALWLGVGFGILERAFVDMSEEMASLCFLLGFLVIHTLINAPLSYYLTMVLDKRFGFSTTSNALFFKDLIQGLVLLVLFGALIGYALIHFALYLEYWWVYAFAFVLLLVIGVNMIYPTLIAPIFNKFTPLEDESLRLRIEELMGQVGFRSSGIFVMDASKRDGRLNAYFGGLGKSKRVILFDTLLKKLSNDGILAILGHELGHFKHKDIVKNLCFNAVFLFALFAFIGLGVREVLAFGGLELHIGGVFAFIFLISPLIGFYLMPLLGALSRRAEYRADEFGASISSKMTLANALVRIINENKSFPYSHPWYVFFHYTHPPLLERLRALGYQIENH